MSRDFVVGIIVKQERGEQITDREHRMMGKLLALRIAGMDNFRYCLPEVARHNFGNYIDDSRR